MKKSKRPIALVAVLVVIISIAAVYYYTTTPREKKYQLTTPTRIIGNVGTGGDCWFFKLLEFNCPTSSSAVLDFDYGHPYGDKLRVYADEQLLYASPGTVVGVQHVVLDIPANTDVIAFLTGLASTKVPESGWNSYLYHYPNVTTWLGWKETLIESFEEEPVGWTYGEVDVWGVVLGFRATDWSTDGQYSYMLSIGTKGTTASKPTHIGRLSKKIDMTQIDVLTVDVKYKVMWEFYGGNHYLGTVRIKFGTQILWEVTAENTAPSGYGTQTETLKVTLNVEDLSGIDDLIFEISAAEQLWPFEHYLYFDRLAWR